MGALQKSFSLVHGDSIPFEDRDVIEIDPGFLDGFLPEKHDARAVNFQFILRTGVVPFASATAGKIAFPELDVPIHKRALVDLYIDFNSDDSFTKALNEIERNAGIRIGRDPCLRALFEKDSWDCVDRVVWESRVAKIVSEEMEKIPGLGKYRRAGKPNEAEIKPVCLNNLSSDIENDETRYEFDCEYMSIVEGCVIQRLENDLLPDDSLEGDYKKSSNYFCVSGRVNSFPMDAELVGHVFIISAATGGIIDGVDSSVSGGSVYYKNMSNDFSLESLVRGDLAVVGDIDDLRWRVYGGHKMTRESIVSHMVDNGYIVGDKGIYNALSTVWADDPWLYKFVVNKKGELVSEKDEVIPPGVQALSECKVLIVGLQDKLKLAESPEEVEECNRKIVAARDYFGRQIDEMVEDGSMYEVIDFLLLHGSKNFTPEEEIVMEEKAYKSEVCSRIQDLSL